MESKAYTVHCGVDIRGMITRLQTVPKRQAKRMAQAVTIDGQPQTPESLVTYLYDELAKGRRVLPMGECPHWDYQTGCGCRSHAKAQEPQPAPDAEALTGQGRC